MKTRSKAKILTTESFFDANEIDQDEDLEMFYNAQQPPSISSSPRKSVHLHETTMQCTKTFCTITSLLAANCTLIIH